MGGDRYKLSDEEVIFKVENEFKQLRRKVGAGKNGYIN